MRKLLFFLFAICFISCEGPEGPRGYDGRDGQDGEGVHWFNKAYTIKSTDWILDGNSNDLGSYYYTDIILNDLNDEIYQWGTVIAYIEATPGAKIGMPYITHKGFTDETGKTSLWTETYDFDYTSGSIRIYLTYSDFVTEIKPSQDLTFHVVMMW